MRYILIVLISLLFVSGSYGAGKIPTPAPSATPNKTVRWPQEGTIGVGGMIGTIGAISAMYWFTPELTFDANIEFRDHPWNVIFADFMWHFAELFGHGSKFGRETSAYIGAGAGTGFWDRSDKCGRWHCTWNLNTTGTGTGMFLRVVGGVEWYPLRTPIGVFAEAGPSQMVFPSSGQTFDFAIGSRYYF